MIVRVHVTRALAGAGGGAGERFIEIEIRE